MVNDLREFSGTSWQADRIHLVRSHLGEHPWYEAVQSWPLQVPARPLSPDEAALPTA